MHLYTVDIFPSSSMHCCVAFFIILLAASTYTTMLIILHMYPLFNFNLSQQWHYGVAHTRRYCVSCYE